MRTTSVVLLVQIFALARCAAPGFALTAQHRLGRDVVPTFQAVHLDLDANQERYSGSVRISLKVRAEINSFQLHSLGLDLARVSLARGRSKIETTFEPGEHGVLTIRSATRLKRGGYTLEIDFANRFDTRADGLYRLETGGHAYAFTQFQAVAARKAFPCWDEPEFKIPWQLTLEVPHEHLAVSNTPIVKESSQETRRRVVFDRTPPLPSYLIAIATGPLETVPVPRMRTPTRVVTVKGASRLAGDAVQVVPPLLEGLERYFGRPYPYRKLDLIAVPEFWAGAMENAGAITFREDILLLDPGRTTAQQRRSLIVTVAHELAHMWFGDLVTMEWWDDFWLNESFASWMGDKISHQVAPRFDLPVSEVQGAQRAMSLDARPSTRAVRQPVDAFDNLDQLADALAYDKGQAVLGMIEHWVGEDAFRKGVRSYLATHEWGNAVGADLWNALTQASGRNVAGPTKSFLNQPGVPLVEMEQVGVAGVRIRQSRFLNHGAQEPAPSQWMIPITIKYSDGSAIRTQRVLLTDSVQTVRLRTEGSLTWLYPNADERGYYRWFVPPGMLRTLSQFATQLTARERMGFVGNLAALLEAGRVRGDEVLRLLAQFDSDPHPLVASATLEALERARVAFVTSDLEDLFALYVRRALGPALDRMGFTPVAGEPEPISLVRPRLMHWLGEHGRDPRVLERAKGMADSYLKDPASVDPTLVDCALELAASEGDFALFEAYREGFEQARLPSDRRRFLRALGAFRDPALVSKALAYSLEGPLRPQELFTVPRRLVEAGAREDLVLEWTRRNFDSILSRIPAQFVHHLVASCGGCSAERLKAGRAFFLDPSRRAPGVETEMARVADQVNACVSLRLREGAAVASYLTSLASK